MTLIIDAHQHLWDPSARTYSWLDDSVGPINRTFGPDELVPQLRSAGVDQTILVQAADTYEDTFAMLSVADRYAFVAGVVGWVPLDRPDEADAALTVLAEHPKFIGMRALIHTYADPDWIVQSHVVDALGLLAERRLAFDLVAVNARHLEHATTLARALPELQIVIDHLAKPPIADRGWQPWADLLAAAARFPNVAAKISGLNTAAGPDWSADDLQPYVDHALAAFSAQRLTFGGEWPVSILAGDYQRVWDATNKTLEHLEENDRQDILGRTAQHIYRLDATTIS